MDRPRSWTMTIAQALITSGARKRRRTISQAPSSRKPLLAYYRMSFFSRLKVSTHHLIFLIRILQSRVWEQASIGLDETRLYDHTTLPYVVRGWVVQPLQNVCERLKCDITGLTSYADLISSKRLSGLTSPDTLIICCLTRSGTRPR